MKTILIINPKGGCGKSTLATNLASYYALWKVPVALVDCDPQHSSIDWLAQRGAEWPPIAGVDARQRLPRVSGAERVLVDAPARLAMVQTQRLFAAADVALVPVLPSPMDIRAAGRFIGDLMLAGLLRGTRVGLVANRVREHTLIYRNLEAFLSKMKIPLVARLRDTQNYIRAAQHGYGVFEMPPYLVDKDMQQWRPLINWVER